VVVNDFNGFRASVRPEEAQAELVVDADTVLTGAIAAQGLQPDAWRDPQVVEAASNLELPQLAAGHSLERLEPVAMRRAPGHACSPHRSTACADPVQTPELMVPLANQPGEIGFCDFTKVKRVEITLRGEPFLHLLAACGGVPNALRTLRLHHGHEQRQAALT
jgi:hypothetical protein